MALLQFQARQLLGDKNLLQLATFSAYLEFDLLSWLEKERSRVAKYGVVAPILEFCSWLVLYFRVVDAGDCLKAVHQYFDWSYPSVVKMDKAETSPLKPGELCSIGVMVGAGFCKLWKAWNLAQLTYTNSSLRISPLYILTRSSFSFNFKRSCVWCGIMVPTTECLCFVYKGFGSQY